MDSVKDFYYENKIWLDFKNSLIYENRFFPLKGEILRRIDKIIPLIKDTLVEGDIWYRAREYEIDDCPIAITGFDSMSDNEKEEAERKVAERVLLNSMRGFGSFEEKQEVIKSFSELTSEKEATSIWGYSKKDSGMPPLHKAGLSRANPRYIPYLYLAKDSTTALAEARALPGQYFSVAKYRIKSTINIVNFCKLYEMNNLPSKEQTVALNIILAFSTPSNADEKDYLVSQFIAEYIKTFVIDGEEFDGIAYYSSRNDEGINLTLFDDFDCEFLGSSIHEVTSIQVKSRQLLPPILEQDGMRLEDL